MMFEKKESKFDISKVYYKMPKPFLKDVKYKDDDGQTRIIKGFIGSVKNIKSVDNTEANYVQPEIDNEGKYKQPQISLSSFFVDRNNKIYGKHFSGTLHNPLTHLFVIPQSEIVPLFHKKRDIQYNINSYKKADSNNYDDKKTEIINKVSNNYNVINDKKMDKNLSQDNNKNKVKMLNKSDDVLQKIYQKYKKLNSVIKDFTKKFGMEGDLTKFQNEIMPIFYNRISFLKPPIDITEYERKKMYNIAQIARETIQFNDETIYNVEHDELLAIPSDRNYKTHFDCAIIEKSKENMLNGENYGYELNIENVKKTLFIQAQCGYPYIIIFDHKNSKFEYKLMSEYLDYLKKYWQKEINDTEKTINNPDDKNNYLKQCPPCKGVSWEKVYEAQQQEKKKRIEQQKSFLEDLNDKRYLKQIKEYEQKQINYIYNKQAKKFNCSKNILKDTLKEILKTDNVAVQLNYLINYEGEVRQQVDKLKSKFIYKYYQGRLNFIKRTQERSERISRVRKIYTQQATDDIKNKKNCKKKMLSNLPTTYSPNIKM